MKPLVILPLLLLLAVSSSYSAEPELIKDKIDEYNYSLGHQLGREILKHKLEFRAQVLWQGVYDAVNNAEPFMTEAEMESARQQLLAPQTTAPESIPPAVTASEKKISTKPATTYRLKGQKFIDENSKKEGVVTLPSGVQYRVIKAGQGQSPKSTETVMVYYRAMNVDGQEFDSTSRLGAPIAKKLTISKLIPGLAEAVPMMKLGAMWEIYIPTRMAFKDFGPMAGQTVIYEMELLEILPEFH